MGMAGQKGFEGWYFMHQKGEDMVAFIPGQAESGAFVQVISQAGARQFQISDLTVSNGVIRADGCRFSKQGCHIELPGLSGEIAYGSFAPLSSDIMGPFRFFPMECRHGVLSMAHTLQGSVMLDGHMHSFDGGQGYAEKDSGTSFPAPTCGCSAAISRHPAPLWSQSPTFRFAGVPSAAASAPSCTRAENTVWPLTGV